MKNGVKMIDIAKALDVSVVTVSNALAGRDGVSSQLRVKICETAEKMGLRYHVGNLLSSDTFYNDDDDATEKWAKMGVMAIEMEAAGLYMNAARAGKRAGALFTISDHIVTGESLPAIERQNSFTDMMKLALETAIRL